VVTLEEINARVPTCRKCKGHFPVVLPRDAETLSQLREALEANKIDFMNVLRAATKCDLLVAKGVMQHATTSGSCHRCRDPIPPQRFSDCEGCGSLNIRLDAIESGG